MTLEDQFRQINAVLSNADSILLVSHENPDPDAVGSVLALSAVFEKQEKKVFSYLPTPPVDALNFLPGFHKISTMLTPDTSFDAAVCLDYGDFFRLRLPPQLAVSAFITVDHHPLSSQRGNIIVVAPEYSSTCEIIYWWLKGTGIPIEKDIATCLLCGIIADTGRFLHASTSPKTFRAIADLASHDVQLPEIFRNLQALHYDASFVKVLGRVLSKITIDEKSGIAYSWATLDETSRCDGGNFYLQDIPSIIAIASPIHLGAFFVEEGNGFVRGSLRAEHWGSHEVDSVARALGGGGHRYAAGFRYRGSIQQVLQKVLELVQ